MKGRSTDFSPGRETFHVMSPDDPEEVTEVRLEDLKALFFVKGFAGDPTHDARRVFGETPPGSGKKLRVVFDDGEVFMGTTQVYHPEAPGFFLVPADTSSNTIRAYILNSAVSDVEEFR